MRNHVQHQQASALPARIDGIDLAQLLRDIGEASATASPVDLFRLCLDAQRVLVGMLDQLPAAACQDIEASMHSAGQHRRIASVAKHDTTTNTKTGNEAKGSGNAN